MATITYIPASDQYELANSLISFRIDKNTKIRSVKNLGLNRSVAYADLKLKMTDENGVAREFYLKNIGNFTITPSASPLTTVTCTLTLSYFENGATHTISIVAGLSDGANSASITVSETLSIGIADCRVLTEANVYPQGYSIQSSGGSINLGNVTTELAPITYNDSIYEVSGGGKYTKDYIQQGELIDSIHNYAVCYSADSSVGFYGNFVDIASFSGKGLSIGAESQFITHKSAMRFDSKYACFTRFFIGVWSDGSAASIQAAFNALPLHGDTIEGWTDVKIRAIQLSMHANQNRYPAWCDDATTDIAGHGGNILQIYGATGENGHKFKKLNKSSDWSSYVRESNVDYIYNAHKIAKNKGLRFYVLWDLYDIRWCDANPSDQAIGTDEVTPYVTGSGLKWVKLDRLITPGQVYHDYLIASVTYLFQNYSFDALCISEFYYKYTDFSAAMKVLWLAENPSYTDWPRNGDGSIDLYNTLLGEWKAAKLSSIVNEITGIAHTYGKKVYWMVRDNFSDADRMARETGQYWPIAKAACDGLWVWAYYNYQTGHRWERLANVVVKLRSLAETGKKHSISIGCWPSTDPLTVPNLQGGLDFLYQKAWTANDEGIEVTPYWLMTPGHFDVLWGSYNGYFNHEISRTQQQIIIITLDYCGRTFGTSPCLATGTPCYNTWGTCRYQSAYTNIGKEYKFSRNDRPLIAPGVRPYLKSYKELPTEIDPEKGLAINARVTLEFYDDENDTDVDVDPYLSQRSGIQGAFWKKLLARNKFYQRRQVIIKKGFQGMSEGDYQVGFKGVIDSISGPANGVVKIIIKDMLKKADAVDVPTATKGKTTDNPLTSSATVINLDSTAEYTASGWVRIDEEIIQYTGKSGNQITGCTRGGFSTTAAQHSQGATVQQCTVWQNQKPFDIINDILQNRVGIAALDIDITGAQADQDKWLPGYAFTGVISEPTKASELIAEICESSLAVIWWDNESQLIKFRVSTPAPPGTTVLSFNDVEHIIAGSTTVSRNEGKRASLVVVHFKKKAIGRDNEDGGYSAKVLEVDADKEGSNEYGERAIKKIYSRWIINDGEANHLASRTLSLFREPPIKLGFSVELKDDDLKTGDLFRLTTDDILDAAGTPEERLYQVLRKEPKEDNEIAFLVMDTRHSKRYGFIAPNGYPNYPSATAQQKEYAFVGNANNKVNGGIEDGYYIW